MPNSCGYFPSYLIIAKVNAGEIDGNAQLSYILVSHWLVVGNNIIISACLFGYSSCVFIIHSFEKATMWWHIFLCVNFQSEMFPLACNTTHT